MDTSMSISAPPQIRIPATYMRGGTSRAIFFHERDLPGPGIERDAIIKALEKTRYNKTAAAKLLGMTFRALRYRIKKLGIE